MASIDTLDIGWLLVSSAGLAQAVSLLVLLAGEGRRAFRANRWLCAFICAAALSFSQNVVDVLASADWRLYLFPLFGIIPYFYLPSVYLYFRELCGLPVRRTYRHYLLPVLMSAVLVVMVMMVFDRFGTQVAAGQTEFALNPFSDPTVINLSILTIVFAVALYVQLVVYMVWLWRMSLHYMRKLGEQMDGEQPGLKRWLVEFLSGITLIFFIYTISVVIDILDQDSEWISIVIEAGFVIVLFRLGHLLAVNPALFVASEPDASADASGQKTDNASDPERTRLILEDDDARRIRQDLEKLTSETDMMFDPLLTMPKMASAVGVKPNQLSFVLNRHIGKSFFDYVNEYRIQAATQRLIESPDRTILDIAIEVGFNSKSTFNLAFKKITGLTPSAYRQQKT
ncbi:AraC family transcriptional regulator [Thalassospira profundimaris]|uniref:helix-turn-helix domain-containing protein n=1 Tax=Thalassospira profundimaris TaxID=502049 RepID=UPI000DEDDE4D|nr:helix-turn-helix domain-containing protein [Thalassospira profundimaris]